MVEHTTTSYPVDRFQPMGDIPHFAQDGYLKEPPGRSIPFDRRYKVSALTPLETINEQLSFLKSHYESIHSLVLVGSTAYNVQTTNSDTDIVIITTEKGHEKVCDFLFAKEIDDSLNRNDKRNFEYTILTSTHVEELFQISSPFAYSIRHGFVLRDDGFLHLLKNSPYSLVPREEYYTSCLYEHIVTPYFGLLKKFQKEARKKGCSLICRKKANGCRGLQSAQLFARLIMKMLYVTLPARGMIPLTKNDTISFAKIAYGDKGELAARQVLTLLREKHSTFCFDDFKFLKEFAIDLYKEILKAAGLDRKVRNIIADAARIVKKDFTSITDPAMKTCVI